MGGMCTFSTRGIVDGQTACPAWVIPVVVGVCVALLVIAKLCARGRISRLRRRLTRRWRDVPSPGSRLESLPSGTVPETAAPADVKSMEKRFDPRKLQAVQLPDEYHSATCVVCLDMLCERLVTAGKCHHFVHRTCMYNWLVRDPLSSCPICRAKFEVDEEIAVASGSSGVESSASMGSEVILLESALATAANSTTSSTGTQVGVESGLVVAADSMVGVENGETGTVEDVPPQGVTAVFQRRWGLV